MNRILYAAAFAAGLLAVAWVATGYGGGHGIALAVTLLIAGTYLAGALELQRYRTATQGLVQSLAAPPATELAPWIAALPDTLRQPVQRRIDGDRAGLPAPSLTPYLVGLLVLLGMVGTFLGMVVTLQGTVSALESTADLQAMRTALAAPVRGLGLAFGTSVAGVCASAMLGLMSALARRERLQAAALLDAQVATALHPFSAAHRREQGWQQLQAQAALMPALVDRVQQLMDRMSVGQERFHQQAEAAYTGLATSVQQTLKDSLAEGARLAGATLQPAVERTLAGLSAQAQALHAQVGQTVQQQGEAMAGTLQATLAQAAAGFEQRTAALVDGLSDRFGNHAQALVQTLDQRQAAQHAALAAHEADRLAAFAAPLERLAARLQDHWQRAGAETLAQQQAICRTLEATARDVSLQTQTHATATIAEVARLMQTASDAPRVAAEVIGQLRQQLSASAEHDNAVLEERRGLMEQLSTLLQAVEAGTARQRDAVDGLAAGAAAGLAALGERIEARVTASTAALEAAAAQGTAGAIEVASLAEAFGTAVQQYGEANERLVAHLQRVEAALDQASTRSDEQLAYTVAQARELIDLTLMSQKQVLDQIHRLAHEAG